MSIPDEDGYDLWLRYRRVDNAERLEQYRKAISSLVVFGTSATAANIRSELARALPSLLGRALPFADKPAGSTLVAGTLDDLHAAGITAALADTRELGEEGFLILSQPSVIASAEGAKQSPGGLGIDSSQRLLTEAHRLPIETPLLAMTPTNCILITGNSASAVLTGTFHFLRLLQTQQDIRALDLTSRPKIRHRLLAHWDNLDGSIERGYAGRSLWNWDELPEKIDARYHDYARACVSIGINGSCVNNVNANPKSLTPEYLQKAAALAEVFRPYGIRIYLSPVLSAPQRLGGLTTSDPREPSVAEWWKQKVGEIYHLIPDFGGFQVKANSEGQPGPQDYGANHAEGANMLADALAPHGGVLLWRAFVYDTTVDADRAKCANIEFVPLDGRFRPNVLVQVKNGPIDFQPREPFHPLFGAMPQTRLALELQVTQEYLGQSIHLVYLGGMWKETLDADTYANGPGSTVARIVDGSVDGDSLSCILGVANTGSDRNWCGHHFSQANWYSFGRLAWDPGLSASAIAEEWIRMTWSNDAHVVDTIKKMMLGSWESCVDYMTPLGLHHIMQEGHHYGPDPAFNAARRPDWNNVYYHRADHLGIGYDRSSTGSNAVSQYHSPLREQFDNLNICPEEFLLWFHHVPWDHRLHSGRTLWGELESRYDAGIAFVERMQRIWESCRASIDSQRHMHVSQRLDKQLENARLWRKVCLEYFGQFAK